MTMLRTISRFPPIPALPVDDESERYLTCPVCGEMLVQPDVETCSRCPYCDHVFA